MSSYDAMSRRVEQSGAETEMRTYDIVPRVKSAKKYAPLYLSEHRRACASVRIAYKSTEIAYAHNRVGVFKKRKARSRVRVGHSSASVHACVTTVHELIRDGSEPHARFWPVCIPNHSSSNDACSISVVRVPVDNVTVQTQGSTVWRTCVSLRGIVRLSRCVQNIARIWA